MEHPSGEMEAKLTQIFGAIASQDFHNLDHFQRVANHLPERLVHVGDQRNDLLSHALARLHHEFSQESRILFALHESTGACLHIEHECIDALREFLAHDGCANKIRTLDSSGYIAQRVKFSIRWRDFCRLADHGTPAGFQHSSEFGDRQVHIESWDRLELVERPASVAETSTADHWHSNACRSRQWSEYERSLISNAAGRMLVDFFLRQ